MSLITCPECGHQVSSKAPSCPECGVAIAGNIKRCPVCNSYLLMSAKECPKCHSHFAVQQTENVPAKTHEPNPLPTSDLEESETKTPEEPAKFNSPETGNSKQTSPKEIDKNRKKSGGFPWYMIVMAVVLLAVLGFAYWTKYTNDAEQEEKEYSLLEKCNDIQNFEDFITRYPKSAHIGDVRARLKELEKEEKEWHEVARSMDVNTLREFLNAYPTSPRRQAAIHRIDSLDWVQAVNANTVLAYTKYIELHDNGEYVTEAYAARDIAQKLEIQARKDSIAAAQNDSLAVFAPFAIQKN